jgi:hypothetical protein
MGTSPQSSVKAIKVSSRSRVLHMENTFYEDTFCPELRQGYKSLVPVFRDLHIEDTFYENTLCPRAMLRDMVTLT